MRKALALLLLCCLAATAFAQDPNTLNYEWANGKDCRKLTSLLQYNWLEDGTLYLYDNEKDPNSPAIEKFYPETGKTEKALDSEKAIESLNPLLSEADPPESIDWPYAFSTGGDFAIYIFENDIFLLDITASEFTKLTNSPDKSKENIRFSPDGNKLAYIIDNDLYVYDIVNQTQTRLTNDGSDTILNGTISWVYWEEIFGRQDIGYFWADDSDAIAYLRTDQSPVPIAHFLDYDHQTPKLITQRHPKAGQTNPLVTLKVTDLTGKQLCEFNYDKAPYEYLVRVKWFDDSKKIAIETMHRDQYDLDMYFMERDTGEIKHIMTEHDDGWVEMTNDLFFIKDNKYFIRQSNRSGFGHLYIFNENGSLKRPVTSGKWSVCSIGGGTHWVTSSICHVDQKNEWIYFGGKKKSHLERHLYKTKFNGGNPQQITKAPGNHHISFSPNGKYYLDTYSSPTIPPSLSLYTSEGKFVKEIKKPKEEKIKGLEMTYPQIFSVKARDGFELPAMIVKPKVLDENKKYPVIVNVYGGPGAPTINYGWQRSIYKDQILLDNGYIVFRTDNRSSTAISKELNNTVLKKMWDDVELNDLVDAVKWLKQQPYVDADNIGIWGHSGGGSYTLLAMTASKEFKAGIAIAAVTDWRSYDSIWAESGMKTPADNPDGYEKTSLLNKAKDLHGRLMIVHGTSDDNVHPQNCWNMVDALIDAGKTFEMMIYPMRKHGISDTNARINLEKTMLEFWDRNLKTK